MGVCKSISAILLCASVVSLSACSSSVASGFVPEQGLSVSQIYHHSVKESEQALSVPRYHIKGKEQGFVHFEAYTRSHQNETQALFKALDNPSIPLFIYPHVALIGDEQLLKPGYSTEFFLYKQNQFALASERY